MHDKLTHKNYDNQSLIELSISNKNDPISSYELSQNKKTHLM